MSIESQFDRMIELLESIDSKLASGTVKGGEQETADTSRTKAAKKAPAKKKKTTTAMAEAAKASIEAAEHEEQVLKEAAQEEKEEITKEMVRLALVKMASVVGQQPARQLLIDVGGAKTLSQLDPARMPAVYRAALDEADKG